MLVCPDCRTALHALDRPCPSCSWQPIFSNGVANYLSRKDRQSAETAEYIETYETLAERNLTEPVLSNRYVEHLSSRFSRKLGDLSGKDVCDVGAGRGFLIKHALQGSPRSVTAIDISATSLEIVSKTYGITALLANAENLPFERQFDVITATDIVEHVLNVSNFLVTANCALRDEGLLAVRVPYLESMLSYSNFYGLPMHYTHLRTFDRTTLVHLVERFGFRVAGVHYDGFNSSRIRQLWRRLPMFSGIIQACLRTWYADEDDVSAINPFLGRLLMEPIEIGIVARKISHVDVTNAYESLGRFYRQRQERRANA
jgi:SAM-dependent methyltransferase